MSWFERHCSGHFHDSFRYFRHSPVRPPPIEYECIESTTEPPLRPLLYAGQPHARYLRRPGCMYLSLALVLPRAISWEVQQWYVPILVFVLVWNRTERIQNLLIATTPPHSCCLGVGGNVGSATVELQLETSTLFSAILQPRNGRGLHLVLAILR